MMFTPDDRARMGFIAPAAPAWLFPPQGGVSVAFNWGRHSTIGDGDPLNLRLFVATPGDGKTSWRVEWHWVTSVETMGGPNPPVTSLAKLRPTDPPDFTINHPGSAGGDVQLNAGEFVKLSPDGGERVGEYLMVNITLADAQVAADQIGLLLVELQW
jgi:hypothetical protein